MANAIPPIPDPTIPKLAINTQKFQSTNLRI
jgi:hypothetical protein